MAKNRSTPAVSEGRLFVLALGLLVGFVIAFVLLLASLPVDVVISEQDEEANPAAEMADINFDYYSVLQEQEAARKPERQVVAVEPPVVFIEPPAQILQQSAAVVQPVATPSASASDVNTRQEIARPVPVQEIPASLAGQNSYFLEAGNYRNNDDALRAQRILNQMGLEAFIVVRQGSNGAYGYRVRMGPVNEQSQLDAMRSQLRRNGIKPRLIRVKG